MVKLGDGGSHGRVRRLVSAFSVGSGSLPELGICRRALSVNEQHGQNDQRFSHSRVDETRVADRMLWV